MTLDRKTGLRSAIFGDDGSQIARTQVARFFETTSTLATAMGRRRKQGLVGGGFSASRESYSSRIEADPMLGAAWPSASSWGSI